jgi:GAF domain-containing protein
VGPVSEANDLGESLSQLTELLLDAQPYEDALRQVAEFSVHALPGADGTSVCLLQGDLPETRVASHSFVRNVDSVQYALGEGPCVDALRTGEPVIVATLGDDPRYPAFGAAALDHGVQSALATPLLVRGTCVGTLNTYAHRPGAFGPEAARTAEVFAAPAAVVLANAQALELSLRMARQLRDAMSSRAVIEQAKGALMAQHRLSEEDAFAHLRHLSQTRHRKLRDVAHDVVAAAAAPPGGSGAPRRAPGG